MKLLCDVNSGLEMKKIIYLTGIALTLSACASLPDTQVTAGTPEKAETDIRAVGNGNILGNYAHRLPVEPKNWRQLNQEQAPKKKGGMSDEKHK